MSSMYTKIIAKTIDETFTPRDAGSAPKSPEKPLTISLAHASPSNETAVDTAPASMNGLRFPHDIRQLSLRIPIYG